MKIKDIGGEFALIERLARILPPDQAGIVQGIGDDAAVLQIAPEPAPYLLVTTDTLVEDKHFKTAWSDPEKVGYKAAECNVSDIAAMGGRPAWMLVSLTLTDEIEVAWIELLYKGLSQSCLRHGITIVGGDTTQGRSTIINIALLGSVSRQNLCLRSHARPEDRLVVTGTLGASAAALALLQHNLQPSDYLLDKHLKPQSRLDVSGVIAPLANAMIDISDGLASEVHHICTQSHVDAELLAADIPLHADVIDAAVRLGVDPLAWALGGGEDYELLFSIPPENMHELGKSGIICHEVGKVKAPSSGPVFIRPDGGRVPLVGGYDHFNGR